AAGEQVLRSVRLLKRPERWTEALGYLDSALRRAEGFKEALWLRGILLAKLRRGEEAVRDFDRLDEITRGEGAAGHVRALVAAGDVCRTQLADRERAAKYYTRAAEAAPDSPFAKLAEARSRVMASQPATGRRIADRAAREAEKKGADASQLRLLVAEIMAKGSDSRSETIEEVGKVLAVDPDNVEALDLRGDLLLAGKHPDKAVSDLSRAAILDPVDTKRLIVLGKALLDTEDAGRHAEAQTILERAAKALPKSKDAKVQLGRALVALRRHEDAIVRLTEVIAVDSKNAAAFRLRGEARIALKRHKEALRDLLKALQLKGRDARVRELLARVYVLLGDPAQAVAHASVAVDLTERREPGALAMFARAYAASGDYARATLEIRNAVRLRPDSETYKQLLRQYADKAKKGGGR
ncbi:MAG: tetratricopeptide repeat protein, partial [Planctomycetota bacterium]